jgi:hypothetical protein
MGEPVSNERLRECFGSYLQSALPALTHIDVMCTIAEHSTYRVQNGRRMGYSRKQRFLSFGFRRALIKHDPNLALQLGAMLPGTNERVQPTSNGSANGSPNPAKGTGTSAGFRPTCGIADPCPHWPTAPLCGPMPSVL